mmetsp:Transcript_77365/g.94842  ORF Transcript_77365/g.94842 Transcript_77365/m.94842 type:complete len:125 (+) Transcript_77365:154-528(+)
MKIQFAAVLTFIISNMISVVFGINSPSFSPTMEPTLLDNDSNNEAKGDVPGTGPSINDNPLIEALLAVFSGAIMSLVLCCWCKDLRQSGVCKKGFRHDAWLNEGKTESLIKDEQTNTKDKLKDL